MSCIDIMKITDRVKETVDDSVGHQRDGQD